MPESEPKPKLIEAAGPGQGQGWKAVLKSGKAAVVHEIAAPPAEAIAAAPRIQRLFERPHPALSPILAWGTDATGIWVAVEPNEGTPLGTILTRGPFKPPAAAALGTAVLSGVAALHEAGVAMGGFNATAVRVTGNGVVRLAGYPAAALRGAPTQNDLRADVRSCGMAVCAAFGVDPAGAPAPPTVPPGLVVTIRSMASGAMGPAADRAQGALREMAQALLAPDRQAAAETELALRSGGREVLPTQSYLPVEAQGTPADDNPPEVAPIEDQPPRRPAPYEAPDRPVETYMGLPAGGFPQAAPPQPTPAVAPAPPVPPAPVVPATNPPAPIVPATNPPASVPSAAQEQRPLAQPLPTWDDGPPRPASPFDGLVSPVNPPAPAPGAPAAVPQAPAPYAPPAPVPPAPVPPTPSGFSPTVPAPPAPDVAWSPPGGVDAAPSLRWDNTPASSPPAPRAPSSPPMPAPAPEGSPADRAWTPIVAPAWPPGEGPAPAPAPDAANAPPPVAPVPPPVQAVRSPSSPPLRMPSTPPGGRAASTVRRPSSSRERPAGGILSEQPPWLIPAAVAVVVVVLLAIAAIAFLGHGKSSSIAATTPSPAPSRSAQASPSPSSKGLLALPDTLKASATAPITSVQICGPGSPGLGTPCPQFGTTPDTDLTCDGVSSCQVDVAVYMTSVQSAAIAFTFKFFDLCNGQTTDLPGPASGSSPYDHPAIPHPHELVTLPSGVKAGDLIVVVTSPAAAISAPLQLGATSC
jgi:hypothetical protein